MNGLDYKPCQVCGNRNTIKHIFTMCRAYEAQNGQTDLANYMEEMLALTVIN